MVDLWTLYICAYCKVTFIFVSVYHLQVCSKYVCGRVKRRSWWMAGNEADACLPEVSGRRMNSPQNAVRVWHSYLCPLSPALSSRLTIVSRHHTLTAANRTLFQPQIDLTRLTMREVISIHVGQAGVQIGNACCKSQTGYIPREFRGIVFLTYVSWGWGKKCWLCILSLQGNCIPLNMAWAWVLIEISFNSALLMWHDLAGRPHHWPKPNENRRWFQHLLFWDIVGQACASFALHRPWAECDRRSPHRDLPFAFPPRNHDHGEGGCCQ